MLTLEGPDGPSSVELSVADCVEIADGSRDIAVGTRVTYRVVAKLGSYEASGLTPD